MLQKWVWNDLGYSLASWWLVSLKPHSLETCYDPILSLTTDIYEIG